jgi:carbon-monoxide dehydrogenase small subunit
MRGLRFDQARNHRFSRSGSSPARPSSENPEVQDIRHHGTIGEEHRMTIKVSLTINGKAVSHEVEERTLLVNFIRDTLRLTGTHVGCDTAQCGACTVHMDGRAIKSCNILAMQAEGAQITTIEGIAAADGTLHPMQEAFRQNHGLQCGFCTPGMVMSAIDLVKNTPHPTEEQIREQLDGNLCRCTGYHNIVKSVKAASEAINP